MDDFAEKLLTEEADLERKLAAVRAMKIAYGIGDKGGRASRAATTATTTTTATRPVRNIADRMDKFGSYGQQIIDMVCKLLPSEESPPVATRNLVDQLAMLDVEVRGENKVNALSALMARSSRIKGFGRAGWTLRGMEDGPLYPTSLKPGASPKENEPSSGDAVGSDLGQTEAGTLPRPWETALSHSPGSTS